MNKKKRVKEKNSVPVEEDVLKIYTDDSSTAQTFVEYQCLGNVEIDFPRLCALMNITDIPAVLTKPATSSTLEPDGSNPDEEQLQKNTTGFCSKPTLQVELETEDSLSAKSIKILGWPVDEQIVKVLNKMFPSMSKLQKLNFWQARLTDKMIMSLKDSISLSSNLRRVTLEGNPVPEHSYHLLVSDDSPLTHLSLRNNRIGDEGARLIGSALSTPRSANENLLSLNLAFNSIGDEGAAHIAKGLRLNRALLSLSLSNNQIGDSGAAHLAEVLGPFALTHEEVVVRRKLLLEKRSLYVSRQMVTHCPRHRAALHRAP
ncbi:leucine-rich repeat-containing protein 71 [Thalassophryne amazonica]|uniref:leucine-rich repeat-containing protein 71 n=1 Tax=Thalassophryne amazonica TaxID=390379 RepID=UPI0014717CB0|nr:leucine-rich repeat-containing protein 71 [Thalassophryne amazonica]XP_034017370.1 leucine-rich repeat-containing protein 71 [Thalassophryne amazonica]XP_034017372.1 leucine-rich repeat-containing protein 71 [Thalassophryne amazonica]